MRTNVGLINTGEYVGTTIGVFLIAVAAKVIPGTLMTKLTTGADWRFSTAVGFCMNTKGMIELVALNVGLNLNIVSPRIFTIMVIMALLTTFIVSPVIWLLYERKGAAKDEDPSDPSAFPVKKLEALRPELQPTSSSSQLVSPTSASTVPYEGMVSPKEGVVWPKPEPELEMVQSRGAEEQIDQDVTVHVEDDEDK